MPRHDQTLLSSITVSARPAKVAWTVAGVFGLLQGRMATRRALGRLDTHLLRDIGLDQLSARAESAKPFWRD
ncbi:MAG: DUF1127 domain-containing protein [Paracoccaceae bacterium]